MSDPHILVAKAIREGVLIRQPCNQCGGPASKSHAHHEDYSRPLDVTWVCSRCHRLRHGELKREANGPTALLCFRPDTTLKAALQRAARDDQRSLSGLIAKILADWVQTRAPSSPKRGERS